MIGKLKNRGPDNDGIWVDSSSGIALGHTRLSIQDLSQAGNQPMVSKSGRYVLIFNGEIYNHKEIRKLLPNKKWRSKSDTESLLVAFENGV